MERVVLTFDDVTRGKILSSDHCLNLLTEYTFLIIKPTRCTRRIICRHNTDNINNDTHIGTRYIILAKHWMWLPDDNFM